MKIIPASPGFVVVFADMQRIRNALADNPDATVSEFVGCQSVIAWSITDNVVLPITFNRVNLRAAEVRSIVYEEADPKLLEGKRSQWARELYNEVRNEKGQAQ